MDVPFHEGSVEVAPGDEQSSVPVNMLNVLKDARDDTATRIAKATQPQVICAGIDNTERTIETLAPYLQRVEDLLPELLADRAGWSSVVVDANPRMHRLYRYLEDKVRVSLHRLDPIEGGNLSHLHYHQWPSIVKIIKGQYKQAFGYGETSGQSPEVCATVDVLPGSTYEMIDPRLWHAPIPTHQPSYSVMVSQKGAKEEGWGVPLQLTPYTMQMQYPPVSEDVAQDMFTVFEKYYPQAAY